MSNRPPIKAAREAAVKRLCDEQASTLAAYVAEELAKQGWEQQSETVTKWRQA